VVGVRWGYVYSRRRPLTNKGGKNAGNGIVVVARLSQNVFQAKYRADSLGLKFCTQGSYSLREAVSELAPTRQVVRAPV
jgi:hypothetical protein